MQNEGVQDDVAVILGGIVPKGDFQALTDLGVAKVFTPADYDIMDIMESFVGILEDKARS